MVYFEISHRDTNPTGQGGQSLCGPISISRANAHMVHMGRIPRFESCVQNILSFCPVISLISLRELTITGKLEQLYSDQMIDNSRSKWAGKGALFHLNDKTGENFLLIGTGRFPSMKTVGDDRVPYARSRFFFL